MTLAAVDPGHLFQLVLHCFKLLSMLLTQFLFQLCQLSYQLTNLCFTVSYFLIQINNFVQLCDTIWHMNIIITSFWLGITDLHRLTFIIKDSVQGLEFTLGRGGDAEVSDGGQSAANATVMAVEVFTALHILQECLHDVTLAFSLTIIFPLLNMACVEIPLNLCLFRFRIIRKGFISLVCIINISFLLLFLQSLYVRSQMRLLAENLLDDLIDILHIIVVILMMMSPLAPLWFRSCWRMSEIKEDC